MPYRRLKIISCLPACLLLVMAGPTWGASVDAKIKVAVSILPQTYFVERIGAGRVEVHAIMPKYADHDTFDPTPDQLIAISEAQVYVKIGISHFNFEQKHVDPLTQARRNIIISDMSKGIPLIPDDPHIWVAPQTVKISAKNICESLIRRDPANAAEYQANLKQLSQDIDALDSKIQKLFSGKRGRSFLIFHPALGYFAQSYGLKQVAIESEGKSPSALRLKKLVNEARSKKVKFILVQKGFDHKSAAVIADEVGAKLLEIDPMEKDWLKNTWEIALKVNEALGR